MKKLNYLFGSAALLIMPILVFAGPAGQAAQQAWEFVEKLNKFVLFPTIYLLISVAFLVFLWGCAEYFINATNEQARQQGVKHITYGIIGLVVMLSAFAILKLATATFGLQEELDCADNPDSGDCSNVFSIPGAPAGGGTPGGGIPGGGTPGGGTPGGGTPPGGAPPP